MVDMIRPRQRVVTAVSPHSGNRNVFIPKRFVPEPNQILNSSWQGIAGSVGGADFVGPTGWGLGFWPPTEAIALPNVTAADNGCSFEAISERGYLTLDIEATIGLEINISVFVDSFVGNTTGQFIRVNNATVVRLHPQPSAFGQRLYAVYVITASPVQLRVGIGTSSAVNSEYSLSRPQATIGPRLHPYEST